MNIPFTKMHGLGNDFALIDATQQPYKLSASQIQQMANRRLGVGFDQLLMLESSKIADTDFHFRIFNADGHEVGQCGNGARCMAHFIRLRGLSHKQQWKLSTLTQVLTVQIEDDHKVSVTMGVPAFQPKDIPFLNDKVSNWYTLMVQDRRVELGVANIGNPHAIIPVERIDVDDVVKLGALLSQHTAFPAGVNVGFMHVLNEQHIRLRVYERGVGTTLACGSNACAAVAVGRRAGLLQERVKVSQPGGSLIVDWQGPQMPVIMTGLAATVFEGTYAV